MSDSLVDAKIGGMSVRVTRHGTNEQTLAIVDAVNARLKEFEAASAKVNTQAFALRAAYEFARELAELRGEVDEKESELVDAIGDIARRIEEFRDRVEESAKAEPE